MHRNAVKLLVPVMVMVLLSGHALSSVSGASSSNPLADDEEVTNTTMGIVENVSAARAAIERFKTSVPTVDYLQLATAGLQEYVSNVTSRFEATFKDFATRELESVQHALIETIRYLNGYDSVNSISMLQNLDYSMYNHNLLRSINSDLRIASISLSEALFDQRDVSVAVDDIFAATDKLQQNVIRLADVIEKGEAWTVETNARAMAAQQAFNESIDQYLNGSLSQIEDIVTALDDLRTYEEDAYRRLKDKIPATFPKSTTSYFIALKKALENTIQKVRINLENLKLYKHRDIEQWKSRGSIAAPIGYMTQVAVQVASDPMLSNDCTESYIEKILAFPNITIAHVNGCLGEQTASEEKTFAIIAQVLDTYVVGAINASYGAFDICFRYAPRKQNQCLELNGYENNWANGRIYNAAKQVESFVDSEMQHNFNACVAQNGYFLNYHNIQEMCIYSKKRTRYRNRWTK
uniref:Protein TsetseEP domain-containing protein n=1 Tax=Anopheles epiroticus TaxID=199890 RepID=A0A182P378_9DIPT